MMKVAYEKQERPILKPLCGQLEKVKQHLDNKNVCIGPLHPHFEQYQQCATESNDILTELSAIHKKRVQHSEKENVGPWAFYPDTTDYQVFSRVVLTCLVQKVLSYAHAGPRMVRNVKVLTILSPSY